MAELAKEDGGLGTYTFLYRSYRVYVGLGTGMGRRLDLLLRGVGLVSTSERRDDVRREGRVSLAGRRPVVRAGTLRAVGLIALAMLALGPASASGSNKAVLTFFGSGGSGASQFNPPEGVAVNSPATADANDGDIYVVDRGNNRIDQFNSSHNFIRAWGWGVENGADAFQVCTAVCQAAVAPSVAGAAGAMSFPRGIAINQVTGNVYVTDQSYHRVDVFGSNGAFLRAFGWGVATGASEPQACTATCLVGLSGSGEGEFGSSLGYPAVDSSGNVFVADRTNRRIDVFSSSGAFLTAIGEAGSDNGQFGSNSPSRVVVDSVDHVYAVDNGNNRVQRFTYTEGPATLSFDTVFGAESLSGSPSPTDVAIGTSDHVFVVKPFAAGVSECPGGSPSVEERRVLELNSAGSLVDTHMICGGINSVNGLALNPVSGRIYVSSIDRRVYVLDNVAPPTATINPVTDQTATTASFTGEVNPQGSQTGYHFEYSANGGASWTKTSAEDIPVGAGTSPVEVSEVVSGLTPNTSYQVRLTATKAFGAGTATVGPVSFTTGLAKPTIGALPVGPTVNSAVLRGIVNPNGSAITECRFEWGQTASYGNSAPCSPMPGSGVEGILVSAQISGLQQNTHYHFRLVATSVVDSAEGADRTLTTGPALSDGRVWERVSPLDKNGGQVLEGSWSKGIYNRLAQAASSGDAVAYGASGSFDGDGAPPSVQYIARRGPDGWTSEGINPPQVPGPDFKGNENYFQWFSEDLSFGVAEAQGAGLSPGDPTGVKNLYLRNNALGGFQTILTGDPSILPDEYEFNALAGTEDGSHVVASKDFTTNELFEWENGTVRKVGILPDGTDASQNGFRVLLGSAESDGSTSAGANPISADGSQIFFSLQSGAERLGLYVRENGIHTTLLSGSERLGGDPETPVAGAEFELASSDGSTAVFNMGKGEEATQLTDKFLDGLYRWDSSAPAGERLTDITADTTAAHPEGGIVLGTAGSSEDVSSIYFVDTGKLTNDASKGPPHLYIWRKGTGVSLVATLTTATQEGGENLDGGVWSDELEQRPSFRDARVTPNGRFIVYASFQAQTSYPTNGTKQIYLYDSLTDETTCISCSTVFAESKANSSFLSTLTETDSNAKQHLPRNLALDGRRFVFDSRDALVPRDTNGLTDVYEWHDGQLDLISSGSSDFPSRLLDASSSGNDIFFTTKQRLVPSDEDDAVDLYDARVGGRSEPTVGVPCIADGCQGTPSPPPAFQSPASASFSGQGNVARVTHCPRGKVRRNGRCRKVHRKHSKRKRAPSERRAAK